MPDHIRVYGPDSFSGIVLGDTGLGRPERQMLAGKEDRRFDQVSPERVDRGRRRRHLRDRATARRPRPSRPRSPAARCGRASAAVKAGKAQVVADEIWMTGIGVTAANKILDDLAKYLPAA